MSIFENFRNLGKIKNDQLDYEYPINDLDYEINRDNTNIDDRKEINTKIYFYLVAIFVVVFFAQLFKLQIVKGAQNQVLAEGNRLRQEEITAPRGIIFDTHHEALVKNIPLYNFEIYPLDLPKEKKERIKVYEAIAAYFGDSVQPTIKEIEENKLYSNEAITIKPFLTRDEAMLLELKFQNFSGARVSIAPAREYAEITGLSHILGYIGKISEDELKNNKVYSISDTVGHNGIELAYEEYLRGTKGSKKTEVDSTGKVQRELETDEPVPGNDLVTTIDVKLQQRAAGLLQEKVKSLAKDKPNIKHAALVASNPQTGAILAMVSLPSYNNNIFSENLKQEEYEKVLNDPDKPMFNRVISGIYPSGSVIKPVIAIGALDSGAVAENTTINDPGEIKIGEWSFPDWKNHGLVDVRKAIAESCNVFFYAIGGGWEQIKGMGVATIKKYLEHFGFGKPTGIELVGEESGTIPDPDWKEKVKGEAWYLGDTYHLAIGQGDFLVTPLQILNATNALANNGKLYKPHLVEKVVDKEGKTIKEFNPEVTNDKLVDNTYSLQVVREGMKECVESDSGSCRLLKELSVSSGGKTGTAQFDASDLKKTHAWFTAFAPYDNPEIAITVLVEEGGDGFDSAEPVARDLLKYYFENKK